MLTPEAEAETETCTQEAPEPVEIEEDKPEIPKDILMDFVQADQVENFYKVDCTYLYNNKFRINVWTKRLTKDSIVADYRIPASYFVRFTSGHEILDATIRDDNFNGAGY